MDTNLFSVVAFFADDALKYYLFRRRPRVSIVGDYKPNTKAAHNHFYRLSDIRPKGKKYSTGTLFFWSADCFL